MAGQSVVWAERGPGQPSGYWSIKAPDIRTLWEAPVFRLLLLISSPGLGLCTGAHTNRKGQIIRLYHHFEALDESFKMFELFK